MVADDVDDACRICLDPISPIHLANGEAIKLGCKCSMDVLHLQCAKDWFGMKHSVVCEVCACAVAHTDLVAHVRGLPAIGPTAPSNGNTTESEVCCWQWLRPPTPPFTSLGSYIAAYASFCLLPGMLCSLATLFFTWQVMHANAVLTMAAAITLSSITILNWVYNCNRPLEHIMFVCGLIGVSMLSMVGFRSLLLWWEPEQQVALGLGASVIIHFVLHYGLVVPLMRLCSTSPRVPAPAPTTEPWGLSARRYDYVPQGMLVTVFVQ